jgi:hypothetical protein
MSLSRLNTVGCWVSFALQPPLREFVATVVEVAVHGQGRPGGSAAAALAVAVAAEARQLDELRRPRRIASGASSSRPLLTCFRRLSFLSFFYNLDYTYVGGKGGWNR